MHCGLNEGALPVRHFSQPKRWHTGSIKKQRMIICLSDRLLPPPSARPPADQNHFTLLHPTVPDTMIMIPQVRLQR